MGFVFAFWSLQIPIQDVLKRRHFVGREIRTADTYKYDVEAEVPSEVTLLVRIGRLTTFETLIENLEK